MLIDAKMDLLDNAFYEPSIQIDASGIGAPAAASPNYGEYSRLQFRDDKPPALSTPMHLDGVPNLSPAALEKVHISPTPVARRVLCLELFFASGGHGHLEQPTTYPAGLELLVC